ncbi:MAG: PQQ-binding-like beta-propeller repeat protein [Mariniblastus sp.]
MSSDTNKPSSNAAHSAKQSYKPLRTWPALLLVIAMMVVRTLPNLIQDGPAWLWMVAAFGPMLCGLLILVWWLFASRARWQERLVGFLGVVGALVVIEMIVDPSMIGPATMMITIPMGTALFATAAILLPNLLSFKRTWIAIILATIGFGFSGLLRNDGMWGDFTPALSWRFTPSAESKLLANNAGKTVTAPELSETVEVALANPEWPGLRGPDAMGLQSGTGISASWSAQPKLVWKIPVGPGWSSFAVAGELLFTQEQRGENEAVVCYQAKTGIEVWKHQLKTRFDDPLGGPGPRATPTIAHGNIYAAGAKGAVVCLNAKTGKEIWKRDLQQLADRSPPMWGFCSSPLALDSTIVVYAGGKSDKGVLALGATTGETVWTATCDGDHSYSSPQLSTVLGEQMVLMLTDKGLSAYSPTTGESRFNYTWECSGYRSLQPAVVNETTILLPTGMGTGTRSIEVSKTDDDTLQTKENWTSRKLKPDFNDLVIHKDHIYGFDNTIFTCIDLKTGKAKWKGGRYGKGQVMLLSEPELLIVAGEKGEVFLVKAASSGHQELGRFQALNGKTWGHPVVIGNRLYIRNAEEAACYELPVDRENDQDRVQTAL